MDQIARNTGKTRIDWVRTLNNGLDQAGCSSWLDHHQILSTQEIGGLPDEVLKDAIHQSVVFGVLLSEHYGSGWTLREWRRAEKQLANPKRKDKLLVIVLGCGGDPGRLGLTAKKVLLSIWRSPAPDEVVQAIDRAILEGRHICRRPKDRR